MNRDAGIVKAAKLLNLAHARECSAEHFMRSVRPDLVVVDYQLIGGLGVQTARIASKRKVPVIVTSGYPDVFDEVRKSEFIKKCRRKGAFRYPVVHGSISV